MATRRAEAGDDMGGGNKRRNSRSAPKRATNNARKRAMSQSNGISTHSGLREELRKFVGNHPHGWGHDEWLHLLDYLRARGHDIHDSDVVGTLLERERLVARLKEIDGIGPSRVRALSDRYGSLWNLIQAELDDLARSARMPRGLAERIRSKL